MKVYKNYAWFMIDTCIYEGNIRTNNIKIIITISIYLWKVLVSKISSFPSDIYDQF